jgi:hypothetical protein
MAYTVTYKKETDGSWTKVETITTSNCDPVAETKTIDDELARVTTYEQALTAKKQTIVDSTKGMPKI